MDLENRTYEFGFSYGGSAIVLTLVYLLLITGASILILGDNGLRNVYKICIMAVMVVPILVCIAVAPVKLTVDKRAIVLHQVAHSITIPVADVTEATIISPKTLDGSIRTFGSGGLMGFLGKFKNQPLGSYIMYASNSKNYILIRTTAKTYVFTPNDPQKVVEAIGQAAHAL